MFEFLVEGTTVKAHKARFLEDDQYFDLYLDKYQQEGEIIAVLAWDRKLFQFELQSRDGKEN